VIRSFLLAAHIAVGLDGTQLFGQEDRRAIIYSAHGCPSSTSGRFTQAGSLWRFVLSAGYAFLHLSILPSSITWTSEFLVLAFIAQLYNIVILNIYLPKYLWYLLMQCNLSSTSRVISLDLKESLPAIG